MITRVPMNISAGTRDARELLVSLLVESLDSMARNGHPFLRFVVLEGIGILGETKVGTTLERMVRQNPTPFWPPGQGRALELTQSLS